MLSLKVRHPGNSHRPMKSGEQTFPLERACFSFEDWGVITRQRQNENWTEQNNKYPWHCPLMIQAVVYDFWMSTVWTWFALFVWESLDWYVKGDDQLPGMSLHCPFLHVVKERISAAITETQRFFSLWSFLGFSTLIFSDSKTNVLPKHWALRTVCTCPVLTTLYC